MIKELYSQKYNLIFHHITKNAMTSIIHGLTFKWTNINDIPDNARNFAVLREPKSRFCSGINYYISLNLGQVWKFPNNLYEVYQSKDFSTHINATLDTLLTDKTEGVRHNGYIFFDDHIGPQIHFLQNTFGTTEERDFIIDRSGLDLNSLIFINHSNLQKDLEKKLNIHVNLPHMNNYANQIRYARYQTAIDKRIEDFTKLYKDDIDLYKKKIEGEK